MLISKAPVQRIHFSSGCYEENFDFLIEKGVACEGSPLFYFSHRASHKWSEPSVRRIPKDDLLDFLSTSSFGTIERIKRIKRS